MFRFTIRDVLWLMALVGLVGAWWVDHRITSARLKRFRDAIDNVAHDWADEVGHPVRVSVPEEGTWTVTEAFP